MVKYKISLINFAKILWGIMLNYTESVGKIEIFGKDEFNPKHILECGQFFRYKKINDIDYEIVASNNIIKIVETKSGFTIFAKDSQFVKNLFNFDTDYAEIKKEIADIKEVKDIVKVAEGLRIMHTDPFETVCSFIISQNNNIKRIKLIIEKLCKEAGTKIDSDHFAFPTIEQMGKLDVEFFRSIGAGYRAKYLAEVSSSFKNLLSVDTEKLSTEELRYRLLKILGVGRKVADCILLFAYNRMDVFPVDVWMERVYLENFLGKAKTREKMSADLVKRFGQLSGYIQQYLFYYKTVAEREGRIQ